MQENTLYDAVVVGGSYAGLSAALTLGRSMRTVLVVDDGKPCNRFVRHSHNFLTHDGESPAEVSRKAWEQVARYPTVGRLDARVTDAHKQDGLFRLQTSDGRAFRARRLLLATGMRDIMPPIEGFAECWGKSIFHCPYCHGYEVRNQTIGILANGDAAFEMVSLIRNWSKDLVLFTNGPSTLSAAHHEVIAARGIPVVEEPVQALRQTDGDIRAVGLTNGDEHPVNALFARPVFEQQTDLPIRLGASLNEHGHIAVDEFQRTSVPGLFAAGDNSSMFRSLSIAVAAGTKAGALINRELGEGE